MASLMPMTLDLALRKALKESPVDCYKARLYIRKLPRVMSQFGFETYLETLYLIWILLIPWKSYDSSICRRCIRERIVALSSVGAQSSQDYRRVLNSVLMR